MIPDCFIEQTPFDTRILTCEDGRLVDLDWQILGENRLAHAVFAGRVTRVDAKIAAAFVDIGLERHGFLRAKDAAALVPGLPEKRPPIDRLVQEGQAVIVQVDREPEGGKGARVSADIRLEGRGGVYFPRRPGKGDRGRLKGFFDPEERDRLYAVWDAIIGGQKAPPALLWQDNDPIDHLLRAADEDAVIAVVGTRVKADLVARGWPIEQIVLVDALPEEMEEALAAIMQPVVSLPGGGDLVIEPTTALVAIDVNGAGRDALSVDLAAAREIARQIRLRRLGGLIVVDFVSLQNQQQDQAVEAALEEALRDDPEQVHMTGLSEFGLLEMSRRRRGPALHERLYDRDIMDGYRLKPLAAAAFVWRKAVQAATGFMGGKVVLHMHPDMIDIWQAGDPSPVQKLSRLLGCHIVLQAHAAIALDDVKCDF